jgi:hypothetical protein
MESIAAHTINCCPLTPVLGPKRSVSAKDAKQNHQAEEPNALHDCIEFSGNFGGEARFQTAAGCPGKLFHTVVEQAGWL